MHDKMTTYLLYLKKKEASLGQVHSPRCSGSPPRKGPLGVTPGEHGCQKVDGGRSSVSVLSQGHPAVGSPTHTFLPIVLEPLFYGGEYLSGRTLKKKKYLSCLLKKKFFFNLV